MLALDQELTQQSARFHEIAGAAQANVAMLDREVARLRAELASALDRSYWLDRLDLDLNALMNRPAARRLRRIWRLTAVARRVASRAQAAAPADDTAPDLPEGSAEPRSDRLPPSTVVAPVRDSPIHADIERVLCDGPVALAAPIDGMSERRQLRLAMVVPHFDFGSGGHAVVFGIARELEQRGHSVSYWLHDPFRLRGEEPDASLRQAIIDDYAPIDGPAFNGFTRWTGADIVIATGWQTVYPALTLPWCRSRAYLVNDHEAEFYGTSVDSELAALTYTFGLPCIVGGGPWLSAKLQQRYDATVAGEFRYPVAPWYRQQPIKRRDDTIVFYARPTTPRRATALGVMALEELKRRRPDIRVVMFGDREAPETTFAYEHLGTVRGEQLAWLYSQATIGMAFSLTHGSLVPHDMMACGLPCVDLDGYSTGAEHHDTGAVELVPFEPRRIAAALERLLDDPELRAARAQAGLAHVAGHTWERAGESVERGLRTVLAMREPEAVGEIEPAEIEDLGRRHGS
jgi:glycosyltransferase involved in cell wall biosynthesis